MTLENVASLYIHRSMAVLEAHPAAAAAAVLVLVQELSRLSCHISVFAKIIICLHDCFLHCPSLYGAPFSSHP